MSDSLRAMELKKKKGREEVKERTLRIVNRVPGSASMKI